VQFDEVAHDHRIFVGGTWGVDGFRGWLLVGGEIVVGGVDRAGALLPEELHLRYSGEVGDETEEGDEKGGGENIEGGSRICWGRPRRFDGLIPMLLGMLDLPN
jgi:hypothetical protein